MPQRRAWLFPGQGSQQPGMGKALAEVFSAARLVFEEVDDALQQPLSRLMFEGEESELTLTQNAQPAIMAVSMAVVRVLEQQAGLKLADDASYVAGHSLGEYSALCAAGCFSLADTARLLRLRGMAMQAAVPAGSGAMAAILGLDYDNVTAAVRDATTLAPCAIANDNADGQVVISGSLEGITRAMETAKALGAKRCIILNVSAPFHCELMRPAANAMADALATVAMRAPSVPVISNVTVAPTQDVDTIRQLLVTQVTGQVRWRETMQWLHQENISHLLEIGCGNVLAGLARKASRDFTINSLHLPKDIDSLLETTV